jgi:hypothetical protein
MLAVGISSVVLPQAPIRSLPQNFVLWGEHGLNPLQRQGDAAVLMRLCNWFVAWFPSRGR